MRIVNMPHAVNKDSKEELLKPNEVRHKRNMRSGSTDSNHMGCCENIKGNVKIPNPYVNPVVEEFNIQTIADPYESGLTSGGGSYLSGQTAIVIATPLSGYTFVNWTENGVEVSGENEYSFAVTRSRTLVANFAAELTEVNYGLLYNWWAATDARNICADGWEVPTMANFQTLYTYLGTPTFQDKIKEALLLYWNNITDVTNEANFNARGSGHRSKLGVFSGLKQNGNLIAINGALKASLDLTSGFHSASITTSVDYNLGHGIRPIKTTTTLTHGQTGTYTGNDGKNYRTICIGTQEWLADNLCETKYRNGKYIPGFDGGVYTPIDDATWAAATTAMCCAYEDNLANV